MLHSITRPSALRAEGKRRNLGRCGSVNEHLHELTFFIIIRMFPKFLVLIRLFSSEKHLWRALWGHYSTPDFQNGIPRSRFHREFGVTPLYFMKTSFQNRQNMIWSANMPKASSRHISIVCVTDRSPRRLPGFVELVCVISYHNQITTGKRDFRNYDFEIF